MKPECERAGLPVLTTAPNSDEKALAKEIRHVIERNPNEAFLRKLLTRAIILEKLQGCTGREGGEWRS